MTNYTISQNDWRIFLKGNRSKGTQFAWSNSTGVGTDICGSYTSENVSFGYPNTFVHHVALNGGGHTHSAKTGYKVVTVSNSPDAFYIYLDSHSYSPVQVSHTNNPKSMGSGPGPTAPATYQIRNCWIPSGDDTNNFLDYLYKFFKNPTAYYPPQNWLFPSGTLPPTLPIYFNDFYHIRTPLYKDGL